MPIIHSKQLCDKLSKIVQKYAYVHLKDGVAELKSKQKKSTVINRNPLYLEIAPNSLTKPFQDESSPRAITIAPYVHEHGTADEIALWLGFVVRFDYSEAQHDFVLTSVSISIIRGSQTQECLLRAEWDSRIEDADHAQPHWHAIPGQITYNNPVDERWNKIQSRLHLAMCAKWRAAADQGNICHTHVPEEEDVISWTNKTLSYIKEQLEYGLKTIPLGASQRTSSYFC